MLLAEFLPSRSAEDILAERVRLRLGGEVFDLPDLSIDETERWQEQFAAELGAIYGQIQAGAEAPDVMAHLLGLGSIQLTLIRGYDRSARLPDDATIRRTASPTALLKAFVEVLAAAHPTLGVLLDAAVRNPSVIRELWREGLSPASPGSPPPTNGSRPPTAGRRARSGAT